MATFSKVTFDAAKYAAARPHYPPALYSHVLQYANINNTSTTRTLVDLGCGPGLSTFPFSTHFDRIIGVDPSKNMIEAARDILRQKRQRGEIEEKVDFRFEQGRGDKLEGIVEDESVDLVVAAQAAHWFDPLGTYKSLARILKPGGSFVFWGYGEIFFPSRPELSELMPPYSGGLLGPYWEQPGRSIVEDLLVPFPLPFKESLTATGKDGEAKDGDAISDEFDSKSFHRSLHLQTPSSPNQSPSHPQLLPIESTHNLIPSIHPILLKKPLTLDTLREYLNTWSSRHKYREEHPPEEEDPVEGLVREMKGRGWGDGEEVEAGFEMGFVMGKKKM